MPTMGPLRFNVTLFSVTIIAADATVTVAERPYPLIPLRSAPWSSP